MLKWLDGFGTYGTTANMLASNLYVWTTNSGSQPVQLGSDPTLCRTGSYYWDASGMAFNNWYAGHMIGGTGTVVGVGAAFQFKPNIQNDNFRPFMFCGNTKDDFQVSLRLNMDLSLSALSGKDGAEFGRTAPGQVVPGAYPYIECKVFCDSVNGTIEVRLNSGPLSFNRILLITGINTNPLGTGKITGVMTGTGGGSPMNFPGQLLAISDYVIYDDSGTINNDFMGSGRARTFLPVTDAALQQWSHTGAGSAFSQIANVPADTAKFISAPAAGFVSNFGKSALPANTAYVAGINVFTTARKSDAGGATITPQIKSGASVATLTAINPGTGDAIYTATLDADPATNAQFARAAFDAALMQVTRTA